MGQTSSGSPSPSDCICFCLDDNDKDENIENWIWCKGCVNWYHRKCYLLNVDYDTMTYENNWYCSGIECQKLLSSLKNSDDKKRPVRERLDRKCKGKSVGSASVISSEDCGFLTKDARGLGIHMNKHKLDCADDINRVTCSNCGFIAKNAHGLSIHMHKHKRDHADVVGNLTKDEGINCHFSEEGYVSKLLNDFGLLLNKCRVSVPLTRIIQKSVRIAVCQELAREIENLLLKNDINSWMRLLAFPYIVLNNKSKGKEGMNVIRSNLNIFRNCTNVNKALSDVLKNASIPFKVDKSPNRDTVAIKVATRKVSEGDFRGAIRVLCSKNSVAPQTLDTVSKLKAKHPDDNGEIFDEVELDSTLAATSIEDVIRGIRSFPLSSSGGIGGLRPRHLKDLTSFTCGESANRLLKAIASLVDVVKFGEVQKDIAKIFFGASLTALMKGEDDVRPIAVGIVWRRLAGKIACYNVKDNLVKKLKPIQLGFGVKGGAEALVHAVRSFCTAKHEGPMALVKFDFGNAFNMLFRKFMLGEVKDICPELLPLLQQAYRLFSNLYYLDEPLLSKRGFQQGDPLGPPGFCIGIMRMTHSLLSRLNGWYLDDGTIGDVLSVILDDIRKVLDFCDLSGLPLNTKKCEVFFINASKEEEANMYAEISALLPGIRKVHESSLEILGSPIFESGLERMFLLKVEEIKIMCDRLKLMDIHPALCLFRKSLGSCRFTYLLRTTKAFSLLGHLRDVDEIFRSTLEAITNVKLLDFSWDQASLPLVFGGLGVRKVVDLAIPAYLSSVYSSSDLANEILNKFNIQIIDDSILGLIETIPRDFIPENDEKRKVQKHWDLPLIEYKFREMFDSSEPVTRARLLASSTKESSKWLQVVPSSQLGLLLDNNAARIAVGLRLGSQLCEEYKCICGDMVKRDGLHGLSCKMKAAIIARHDDVNKVFSHGFSSAGFPVILQPTGISRDDGKRPDGMTLIPWSHGKSLLWDVTIRDTLAPSYINESSKKSRSIAEKAERYKHNHYIHLKENYLFTPIAFESLGCMGPETKKFINKLGSLMKAASGESRSTDYLLQKISIAIQRGNSACILGTLGKHRVDEFYLL